MRHDAYIHDFDQVLILEQKVISVKRICIVKPKWMRHDAYIHDFDQVLILEQKVISVKWICIVKPKWTLHEAYIHDFDQVLILDQKGCAVLKMSFLLTCFVCIYTLVSYVYVFAHLFRMYIQLTGPRVRFHVGHWVRCYQRHICMYIYIYICMYVYNAM
jgi:hypothetical protein